MNKKISTEDKGHFAEEFIRNYAEYEREEESNEVFPEPALSTNNSKIFIDDSHILDEELVYSIGELIRKSLGDLLVNMSELILENIDSLNTEYAEAFKEIAYPDSEMDVEKMEIPISCDNNTVLIEDLSFSRPFDVSGGCGINIKGTDVQLFNPIVAMTIFPFFHGKQALNYLKKG